MLHFQFCTSIATLRVGVHDMHTLYHFLYTLDDRKIQFVCLLTKDGRRKSVPGDLDAAKGGAPKSSKKCEWRCGSCNHYWIAPPKQIFGAPGRDPTGCPYCAECSRTLCGSMACHRCWPRSVGAVQAELHMRGISFSEMRSGKPASLVLRGSGKDVWWTCLACNFAWQGTPADVLSQTRGCRRCPKIVMPRGRVTAPTQVAAALMGAPAPPPSRVAQATADFLGLALRVAASAAATLPAAVQHDAPAPGYLPRPDPAKRISEEDSLYRQLPVLAARQIICVGQCGITARGHAASGVDAAREVSRYSHTQFEWACGVCHHHWAAPPHQLLGGQKSGCPFCADFSETICEDTACGSCRMRTVVSVRSELLARRIEFSEAMNYLSAAMVLRGSRRQHVWWNCLSCQKPWHAPPTSVLYYNFGCPACARHCVGEKLVHDWLSSPTVLGRHFEATPPPSDSMCPLGSDATATGSGVTGCTQLVWEVTSIDKQKTFAWCRNSNALPFDFRVVFHEKTTQAVGPAGNLVEASGCEGRRGVAILVELDGVQHFTDSGFFKTVRSEQVGRDVYKMWHALRHGAMEAIPVVGIVRLPTSAVSHGATEWLERLLPALVSLLPQRLATPSVPQPALSIESVRWLEPTAEAQADPTSGVARASVYEHHRASLKDALKFSRSSPPVYPADTAAVAEAGTKRRRRAGGGASVSGDERASSSD